MILGALARIGDARAVGPLLTRLEDAEDNVDEDVAEALGRIGGAQSIEALEGLLGRPDAGTRGVALSALVRTGGDHTDVVLVSRDLDGLPPWLDPLKPISNDRVAKAASRLGCPVDELRARYGALAERYGLPLEWRAGG